MRNFNQTKYFFGVPTRLADIHSLHLTAEGGLPADRDLAQCTWKHESFQKLEKFCKGSSWARVGYEQLLRATWFY